jgi:serine/threonine protein kinase
MQSGDRLGPYELVCPVGAGGMGEVWKARDTRLDRFVAIKISKESFNDRFLREARTIAKLDHPHICRLYDIGPNYLVMELLDGKPLAGPLPVQAALTYAIEICSALFEAHHTGITHRDLKPANILVTKNGVVLLDFGLAKMDSILAAGAGDETIIENTQPGQIVGTLHYMSPEQLQGKPADARSDIFSFGLVLYEMLTGNRAVSAEDPASVISEIILGSAPEVDTSSLHLPAALGGLVQRCLAKKPDDRWQSARDIQWVLEEIRSAPTTVSAAVVAPSVDLPRRQSWTLPRAAVIALFSAMLLLGSGGWWWLETRLPDIPEWRVRPLTAYAGLESMPALSPDGKLVAFVWNGDAGDNFDIYVKPIGDETLPLRITSSPADDSSPCWSPDGDKLAFLRKTSDGVNVVIASSHGGGERIITSLPAARNTDMESKLSWSPDGRYLAVASGPILRLNVETREIMELTGKVPPSQYDSMPTYSPDGSALAFARGPYAASRRLLVQKLNRDGNPQGEPSPLTNASQGLTGFAWWPERKRLITAIGYPDSFMEAVWIPLAGGDPHYMPLDGTAVWYPDYNPTLHRLVYQRRWLDLNIVRGSLRSPDQTPQPVVASTHMDLSVDVAPDGEHIVFASSRTGTMAIWRADRNGANQILLASIPNEPLGSPRWTPDGKSIIFDGGRAGSSALYTVSAEGGIPSKMPANGQLVRPFVSPDGKWVYYTNSATGRREVYKLPFGGGQQTQLTHEGGTDAMTSPDGATVFYYRDGEVRRIAAGGGPETTVTTGVKRGKWTVSGEKIYAIRLREERSVVVEMTSAGANEKVVYQTPFPLRDPWSVSGISVSARTGDIYLQQQARLESDLMIVENFR